jgi:hypothetical protein
MSILTTHTMRLLPDVARSTTFDNFSKPSGSVVKVIKLTMDPDRDQDLIEFFDGIPKGLVAHAVRKALRGGMNLGRAVASSTEDSTAAGTLDDMLGAWQQGQ